MCSDKFLNYSSQQHHSETKDTFWEDSKFYHQGQINIENNVQREGEKPISQSQQQRDLIRIRRFDGINPQLPAFLEGNAPLIVSLLWRSHLLLRNPDKIFHTMMSLRNCAIEQKGWNQRGPDKEFENTFFLFSLWICHFGSSGGPLDELETKIPLSQSKLSNKNNGFAIVGGQGPTNQQELFEEFETEALTFTNLV